MDATARRVGWAPRQNGTTETTETTKTTETVADSEVSAVPPVAAVVVVPAETARIEAKVSNST